jgi:hypothetical protein
MSPAKRLGQMGKKRRKGAARIARRWLKRANGKAQRG